MFGFQTTTESRSLFFGGRQNPTKPPTPAPAQVFQTFLSLFKTFIYRLFETIGIEDSLDDFFNGFFVPPNVDYDG